MCKKKKMKMCVRKKNENVTYQIDFLIHESNSSRLDAFFNQKSTDIFFISV